MATDSPASGTRPPTAPCADQPGRRNPVVILEAPSPNHGPRRGCEAPDLVLIHYTGMETAEAALDRLRDPAAEVSAHYLISERGRIWRLVDERRRAWHAGRGQWGETGDVNSHSVGIELANAGPLAGYPPFPEAQMTALESLLDEIGRRWRISPARVLGHSDTAPGRKVDPGPKFDWRRLAHRGHAIWPAPAAAEGTDPAAFRAAALAAGYRAPDGEWSAVLHALRLRFRPWALDKPLEAEDIAIAGALPPAAS